ncbi:hypothetical protein BKA93DRAFT_746822 [Sparassis latifolia]
MKFTAALTSFIPFFVGLVVSQTTVPVTYETTIDHTSLSLDDVASSNILESRGYATLSSLLGLPYVGGSFDVPEWNFSGSDIPGDGECHGCASRLNLSVAFGYFPLRCLFLIVASAQYTVSVEYDPVYDDASLSLSAQQRGLLQYVGESRFFRCDGTGFACLRVVLRVDIRDNSIAVLAVDAATDGFSVSEKEATHALFGNQDIRRVVATAVQVN